MHLITTEDTDTVMELIRGAQTVFLCVKTEAKRWNAPPIAPSTQAELKDEFAPPPKKEIKNDGKPVEGQNMSGASQGYSASAFSLTTQVVGVLFSW